MMNDPDGATVERAARLALRAADESDRLGGPGVLEAWRDGERFTRDDLRTVARAALAAARAGETDPLTACPRCAATDGVPVTTPTEGDAWRCPSCGVVGADYPGPLAADRAGGNRDALAVLIDTARDVLDNDGGYLAADERAQISAAVDALAADAAQGDATPTVTEWGVRWPWRQEVERDVSRGGAEWRAAGGAYGRTGVLVTREVTEWREVQP